MYEHFYDLRSEEIKRNDTVCQKMDNGNSLMKRTVPLFFNTKMKYKFKGTIDESSKNEKENIEDLQNALFKLHQMCAQAAQPRRCCGRRHNCCTFSMISLFHENKQTGFLLQNSFKGQQYWIPPILKQLEDAKKVQTEESVKSKCISFDTKQHAINRCVKIDAMFFSVDEEPSFLQGNQTQNQNTADEESYGPNKREYLKYDTVILCNPNAMAY